MKAALLYIKTLISILCLCTGISSNIRAQNPMNQEQLAYIHEYKNLAISEQNRTGIPAAIKLAQGLLESASGKSELALNAHAHFGIKCKPTWKGMTYSYDDDAKDECFRKYASPYESYMDHSDFLMNNKRYSALFDLDVQDYKGWAHGLKKCGYATNPKYAAKLIEVIERYHLHEYTLLAMNGGLPPDNNTYMASVGSVQTDNAVSPSILVSSSSRIEYVQDNSRPDEAYYTITNLNGIKGFYAKKGDMLLQYAIQFKVRYARLLTNNELEDAPLPYDMFIYIDKKRVRGLEEKDRLSENETLHQFSQRKGILMDYLLKYNHLAANEQPEAGSVLYLQNNAPQKPSLTQDLTTSGQDAYAAKDPLSSPGTSDFISKSDISYDPLSSNESDDVDEDEISKEEDIATSTQEEENNVANDTKAVQDVQIDFRNPGHTTSVDKGNNTNGASSSSEPLDPLIQRFDNSIYAGSKPEEKKIVREHFNDKKNPPQQFKNEDQKQPQKDNTLNRAPRRTTDSGNNTAPGKTVNVKGNPAQMLDKHMAAIYQSGSIYVPKQTGTEHTSAPTPPKTTTKKAPPKKTTTQKKKTTPQKKSTPTKKTAPKKKK